jgi:uncharacterized protein YneF (UPF0154 family)
MSVGSLILLFICVAIMVGVVVAFLLPQKDGLLSEEKDDPPLAPPEPPET